MEEVFGGNTGKPWTSRRQWIAHARDETRASLSVYKHRRPRKFGTAYNVISISKMTND